MSNLHTRAIILAAGKSTRFKTKKSKLLFSICGQPMILYPLNVLQDLAIPMTLVLGHQSDDVLNEVKRAGIKNVSHIIQEQQLGTGHALACSRKTWDQDNILILYGDMPLITKELIQQLLDEHAKRNATVTFFTSYVIDPTGYGRVLEQDGKFQIVEEKDCTEEQRYINRINAGIYVMKQSFLNEYLFKIDKSAVTGEIYLPELIKMACDLGLIVHAISVPFDNVRGVNTLQELWSVEQIKRSEFIKYWMSKGVRFELAQSIHIDMHVDIGPGSFIGTGVHLLGNTKIGEECFIGAFTIIDNATIGDSTMIHSHTVVQSSTVGSNVHVGPFARLHNNVVVSNNAEIGNFIEMKDTTVGLNSMTRHLCYVSDTTIGANVKIGAGTITCNFDGTKRNKTVINDNSFVGGNITLVAPVTIGKGSYVAAGSTINQDVPDHTLAIAREKQVNKVGYTDHTPMISSEKEATCCCETNQKAAHFSGAVKVDKDHKLDL